MLSHFVISFLPQYNLVKDIFISHCSGKTVSSNVWLFRWYLRISTFWDTSQHPVNTQSMRMNNSDGLHSLLDTSMTCACVCVCLSSPSSLQSVSLFLFCANCSQSGLFSRAGVHPQVTWSIKFKLRINDLHIMFK